MSAVASKHEQDSPGAVRTHSTPDPETPPPKPQPTPPDEAPDPAHAPVEEPTRPEPPMRAL